MTVSEVATHIETHDDELSKYEVIVSSDDRSPLETEHRIRAITWDYAQHRVIIEVD